MRRLAVMKGMLAGLLVMLLLVLVSRYIELPTAREQHLAAMTYHKRVPLTNQNLVDVLSAHVDTTTLHAIRLKHTLLEVELLLHNNRPADVQIYEAVPLYIALAFHYSDNVEQLAVKVLREGGKAGEEAQLIQLTVYSNDAWLEQGVQALQDVAWLEQQEWAARLRIQKSIFWQLHYEV